MEKKIFINELKEGDKVKDVFLVCQKRINFSKNGLPYINFSVRDCTGQLDARCWDRVEAISSKFETDDIVFIDGFVNMYQGKLQLTTYNVSRVDIQDFQLSDFLPSSKENMEEMFAEFCKISSKIQNAHLKSLVRFFIDDEDFIKKFKKAPAAKSVHHDYLGGLLEHTLSVGKLALLVGGHYSDVDPDLLLSGALLHDIGKVEEIKFELSFDHTDRGRLIGHLIIGMEMVGERIARIPDFPPELEMLIKHLILSHHGEYQFGSPKRPKFAEAIILHYLDDLDARLNIYKKAVESDTLKNSSWTEYNKYLERFLYKKTGDRW